MARGKTRAKKTRRENERARREAMDKLERQARDACTQLGVKSDLPYGWTIYADLKKFLQQFTYNESISLVRNSPRLLKAQHEWEEKKKRNLVPSPRITARIEANRQRSANKAAWDAAHKHLTTPSKGLTFGIKPITSAKAKESAPVVEIVAPVVVPAPTISPKNDEPEQRNQFAETDPAPVPSGLLVAGLKTKPKPGKPIEGLADVIRERIPGGLNTDFRKFVIDKLYLELTADELADRFLTERGLMPSVTEQASISVPNVKPATVEEVQPVPAKKFRLSLLFSQ